jgi:N-acetylglucosamine repressor
VQKATRKQTKAHNRRLVLKTIYDEGQISRADISRATGLTRTTVSDIIAQLVKRGLVAEVGFGPSGGGKRPILLSVMDDSYHLIGIDLASGEFRGAVVNLRGQIWHQATLPLHGRDGDAALAIVFDLVDALVAASDSPLLGIGIGTPGLMDPLNGVVRKAVNLNWQDLALGAQLYERYNLPVYVANDAQMAALAEHAFGKGRDDDNLVVVKVGHGIGAGIVLKGQLFYGDTCGAGEIGHVAVVQNGHRCRCGNFGCLETVASARAIVQRAREISEADPHSTLKLLADGEEGMSLQTVCQALRDDDPASRQLVETAGHYLGIAVANLTAVLGIRRVLIAGSVTCLGQDLLDVIREEMKGRSLAAVACQIEMDLSDLGSSIVILGASALVLTQELGLFAPLVNGTQ